MAERRGRAWAVAVLAAMIGAFMVILDSTIVNVALPTMMREFGAATDEIEWVLTIYMLVLGVVVPMSGWLGDFLGYRRLYVLSLAAFVAGSALCGLAWSTGAMVVFRAIQAAGGGMMMPVTMAMIYRLVPRERIGSAMGTFGLAMLVAPAIGPTLGGYLVEYVNWRWIFTINVPVGIAGVALSLLFIPEFEPVPAGRFDGWGALTAGTGLFFLLYALAEGPSAGWTAGPILAMLAVAFVSLAVFVWHELRTPEPLLDLRLFAYPTFTLGNLHIALVTTGLFAGLFYLPVFLQDIRGLGALETGLLLLPPAVASAVMMPVAGRLYDWAGPRALVPAGTLLLAASTYLFHRLALDTPLGAIVWWSVLRSAGMGLTMMPAQTAALSVVPTEKIGRASAITNIVNRVAASFGIALLTNLLQGRVAVWRGRLAAGGAGAPVPAALGREAFTRALDDVFLVMALLMLLAVIPAAGLRKGDGGRRAPAHLAAD